MSKSCEVHELAFATELQRPPEESQSLFAGGSTATLSSRLAYKIRQRSVKSMKIIIEIISCLNWFYRHRQSGNLIKDVCFNLTSNYPNVLSELCAFLATDMAGKCPGVFLKNIQWLHTHKCSDAILNRRLSLGSSNVPSTSQHESQVLYV